MSHVSLVNASRIKWIRGASARWRRPIGCLKFQVIFRKRATNYRALLQKMTCRDKASYGSWARCIAGWVRTSYCMSHVSNEWLHPSQPIASWMNMYHVSLMNGPCIFSECIMFLMWMHHVLYVNASCLLRECIVSFMWMHHVSYESVVLPSWMRKDIAMHESRLEWVSTAILINEPCL